ncbi:hypothetical protein EGR_04259 [Echinococcus granulosus]|uniref:Uncharacterized protein n=1 Tax=Echinococcus granulosus TaxID=6210 RepID=W6UGY9_ECHGR|nr:hypothetical protein EGR_04259 [Echinococcus granulosus]EUB60820.1 hypothetical protein EGR_04259 [Echinococcus granulosus]
MSSQQMTNHLIMLLDSENFTQSKKFDCEIGILITIHRFGNLVLINPPIEENRRDRFDFLRFHGQDKKTTKFRLID